MCTVVAKNFFLISIQQYFRLKKYKKNKIMCTLLRVCLIGIFTHNWALFIWPQSMRHSTDFQSSWRLKLRQMAMGLPEGSPQSTWSDFHPLTGSPLFPTAQWPPSPKHQSLQLILCRALRERDLTQKCLCVTPLLKTLKSFAITQK